ncbi:MAG: ABC transporter permease subunit [Myxococcaceae bacterium]
MNRVLSVARREFRAFFSSPIAYVVLGVFLLVSGYLFFSTLFLQGQASLRNYFSLAPVLFVVFIPALTMRLLAEERKAGTLELLLTFPVRDGEVVTGKFLAALGMVAVGLACTLPYPVTLSLLTAGNGTFDWGTALAGYVGFLFLASAFIALGLWTSAASKNQIVAFIFGLLACFALYIVDKFAPLFPERIAGVLQYISVDYHFDNIARGVIDTRDVLFYATLTALGLLFATRTLAAVRQ